MIPHHGQAVKMADLAADRASSTDVKTLAALIEVAQDPEIAATSGWLAGWGEIVLSSSGTGDVHHGGNGMMSDADMTDLAAASGAALEQMWVPMMIEHHTGVLEMAAGELADGQNPDAQAQARSITTSQAAEFATMRSCSPGCPRPEG